MEAVPKLPMLRFELKTSLDAQFGPKLKQFIIEAYRESLESYNNECHQLEGIRANAVRATIDEAGLKHLCRYYSQLRVMQSRFPMGKGQPGSVTFIWKDIYAHINCTSSDIRYEMASILYNIAALHTQLGAEESRSTPESLKAACTHYQHAAWALQYLKDSNPQPPGVDVCPEIMRFLEEICLAQAQECIMEKSIQDTRKCTVVGAVARQVALYYKNSMALLGLSTGSDNIHEIISTQLYNKWHRYLSFKRYYISALVCLYQGINSEEEKKMGERVAFFQMAVDKLNEARKLAKYIEPKKNVQEALTFTNDVLEGKRKAAKNENEFIYHEEVPDKIALAPIKPVCLVKHLPINFNDPELCGTDIFAKLIPMGAHERASLYSEEKAKLLRRVVAAADAKDAELAAFMSSLQLEQLDLLDAEQQIPQEIVDRCAALHAKPHLVRALTDAMNALAAAVTDVEHTLADCRVMIQEEVAAEKEYQKSFGPRPPSIVQTELSREFHKYQEAHARTNESNQVLHKAMTLHIANLRLLALPLDELEAKIPSIANIEGLDRDTMREMRRVAAAARDMRTQRDQFVRELRAALAADDVTPRLLAAPAEPPQPIFDEEIEKHTPKVKLIDTNLSAQENIVARLTALYAACGESRRLLADVARRREALVNALIASYDAHAELASKCAKGQEFYARLGAGAAALAARLRGACQVQREERALQAAGTDAPSSTAAPTPQPSAHTKPAEMPAPSSEGYTPKLKDYLPFMKNRRSVTPQAVPEALPSDGYYPETIYPTTARPTPVGSEATSDQTKYTDGYAVPSQIPNPHPYSAYANQYANESVPYATYDSYPQAAPNKHPSYDGKVEQYGYNTYAPQSVLPTHNYNSYIPQQDSGPAIGESMPQPSVNPMMPNQYANDPAKGVAPYGQTNPMHVTNVAIGYGANPTDLSGSFSQMHIKSEPKPEGYNADYSQSVYANYPQASATANANVAYGPPQVQNTMAPLRTQPEAGSINYQYNSEPTPSYQAPQPTPSYQAPQPTPSYQAPQPTPTYQTPQPTPNYQVPQSYNPTNMYSDKQDYPSTSAATSQHYQVYNPESVTLTNVVPDSLAPEYKFSETNIDQSLLAAIDQPIQSHIAGHASTPYAPYGPTNAPQPPETSHTQQTYQNHPGYNYNMNTGAYDYNYGSQNTFAMQSHANINSAPTSNDPNWPGVYTSAGTYGTVQSPSEQHPAATPQAGQAYYNTPYGYQTAPPNAEVANVQPELSNYNAYANQSTYMQSGQMQETSVTYTSSQNQVSTTKENAPESSNIESSDQTQQYSNYHNSFNSYQAPTSNIGYQSPQVIPNSAHQTPSEPQPQSYYQPNDTYQHPQQYQPTQGYQNEPSSNGYQTDTYHNTPQQDSQPPAAPTYQQPPQPPALDPTPQNPQEPEVASDSPPQEDSNEPQESEQSTFDLLSGLDFTVEHTPLTPDIKVPPVSETYLKTPMPARPKPVEVKQEVIERPERREVFSDPGLLNRFTEEVKKLQKLVDSLSSNVGGITMLDSKWKMLQDVQAKESLKRPRSAAPESAGAAVPYDDSRLVLTGDAGAYINASYYRQLSPWCVPLVLSRRPERADVFWRAVLQSRARCVVCLLGEAEMQGQAYWPTAKGQSLDLAGEVKVTLEEVTHSVHWTERALKVTGGGTQLDVTHYQINVFPAKIVCSPLVLLVDRVLSAAHAGRAATEPGAVWLHCSSGGGRSALVALLTMLVCEVRAGRIELCDMLENGCINLYKHRTNVLEDTKFLADVYRTASFYVQGVLCSGTTAFSGEAVAASATVAPPAPDGKLQKFSKESFEEMKKAPGLTSGDMRDPLNFLDPLWSLKKK